MKAAGSVVYRFVCQFDCNRSWILQTL